jgi:hypothetical protein
MTLFYARALSAILSYDILIQITARIIVVGGVKTNNLLALFLLIVVLPSMPLATVEQMMFGFDRFDCHTRQAASHSSTLTPSVHSISSSPLMSSLYSPRYHDVTN